MNSAATIALALAVVGIGMAFVIWWRASGIALRAVHQSGVRVERFKLTRKPFIRATLLADDEIARAVKEHAAENSMDEAKAWARVEEYVDEIVPFFNILTYYKVGLVVSRLLLNFFYKVSAEYAEGSVPSAWLTGPSSKSAIPRDAIVIYLMNHRSNADYVLVGYVLSGQVAQCFGATHSRVVEIYN